MKKLILFIAVIAVVYVLFVPQLYNKLNESQGDFSHQTNSTESRLEDASEGTETSYDTASEAVTEVLSTESDVLYIKEHNGRIGVWKNPASKPFLVLDIYTFTLPEKDRELIQKGFCISADELERLICDYTG